MEKPTIRTITGFISFQQSDFAIDVTQGRLDETTSFDSKVERCVTCLNTLRTEFQHKGFQVQTIRLATNPFGEWLFDREINSDQRNETKNESLRRLERLDSLLAIQKIDFCSVGPATDVHEAQFCRDIVATSSRFCCSMNVEAGAVEDANVAASIIREISKLGDGQGNFRFCASSSCKPFIPFFPASKSDSKSQPTEVNFAIGLENGSAAQTILKKLQSIGRIQDGFAKEMARVLLPIQDICEQYARKNEVTFLGIDSSLNPSLQENGSVASSIEQLDEVKIFGGPGTVAAAAKITTALQNMEGIKLVGYCGLMLPVCEDTRLAQLTTETQSRQLRISDLLSVSSVCGVGLDTVPLPGEASQEEIASLILDMAGIAGRWNKSLTARLFPIPGKKSGDMTTFDSPYLVNARVFSIE